MRDSNLFTELADFYKSKREEIYRLHTTGSSGPFIVCALSDLTDCVVYRASASLNLFQEWKGALVAIGGYGRRELSPLSDMDLMILTPAHTMNKATVSDLLCVLWDLGLKVGHAYRTIDDCLHMAQQDMIVATSMLESRFLAGDRDLFDRFHEIFFKKIVYRDFMSSLLRHHDIRPLARRSPYLAEPNIKTSPGGLRDIHYMKWVALPRYRTNDLAGLYQAGRLTEKEYQTLTDAQGFLWRVRNELHFKKADDHLTVERQEEMAVFIGFESRVSFMRHYYTFSAAIAEIATGFIRDAVPKSIGSRICDRLMRTYCPPGFYLYRDTIVPLSSSDHFFKEEAHMIRLFLLAKEQKKTIPRSVLAVLHSLKQTVSVLSPETTMLFRRLLAVPGGIADILRKMHYTGMLWQILPEFSDIQGLVQESLSHFFTTDEHTFQAVEEAENLIHEPGPFGDLYRGIRRKDILHLALLLHDLGKGKEGDHSRNSAAIADNAARRLMLTDEERALLILLVEHHLLFSEVAFYRDFTDEPILLTFAQRVGRPETLTLLLILTVADIRAVSPGAWNSWKGELLLKLYNEALMALSGERLGKGDVEGIRLRLKEVRGKYPEIWQGPVLQALTPRYLLVTPFEKITGDLEFLFRLLTQPIQVAGRYDPDTETTEYTFYTTDAPGLFLKIIGVLAARGFSIMSAQLFTQANGMVVNTFSVIDPYIKEMSPEMTEEILSDIKRVVVGAETIEDLFRKRRRYPQGSRMNHLIPVQVEVDNESSYASTIIDIFAPDFPGLLYQIAKTLFHLGLSVHSARIATRLDQIVDVFYVQSKEQGKITDPEAIHHIKFKLKNDIENAIGAYKISAHSSPLT